MFKKVLFFSFVFFGSKSFCVNVKSIVWHVEGQVGKHFFVVRGIPEVDWSEGDRRIIMREFNSFSGGAPVQVGRVREMIVEIPSPSWRMTDLAVHLADKTCAQDIARAFGYSPESLLLLEPRISKDED